MNLWKLNITRSQLREEQKTEEEKADELKRQYKNLLKHAESDEDRAAIERKINSIDEDIAESKAKELADQQKRLADQRDALAKSLGISLDFSAVQTEEERFAADLEKLRAAYNDGSGLIESGEDLEEAERRLAEKYSEARFADWLAGADSLSRLSEITDALTKERDEGVLSEEKYNKILADAASKEQELVDAKLEAIPGLKALIDANDAEKKAAEDYAKALKIAEEYTEESPFDKGDVFSQEQLDVLKNGEDATLRSAMIEYASAMEAAAQGLEDEVLDRETYDELVNRANGNLAKATDDYAKKLKDDVRSELGIDSIMESLKSPIQKYNEAVEKARIAFENNQITGEEFEAYRSKVEEDIRRQYQELGGAKEKFAKEDARKKDDAPSKSMEAGSADLYLAQIKSSQSYQSKVLNATEKMGSAIEESLDETRQTNFFLSELLAINSAASYPVWG